MIYKKNDGTTEEVRITEKGRRFLQLSQKEKDGTLSDDEKAEWSALTDNLSLKNKGLITNIVLPRSK